MKDVLYGLIIIVGLFIVFGLMPWILMYGFMAVLAVWILYAVLSILLWLYRSSIRLPKFLYNTINARQNRKELKAITPKIVKTMSEFRILIFPNQLLTDSSLNAFKDQYLSLYNSAQLLCQSPYLKGADLRNLDEFCEMFKSLSFIQEQNKVAYESLQRLKTRCSDFEKSRSLLFNASTYCTHSAMQLFRDEWKDVLQEGKDYYSFIQRFHLNLVDEDIKRDITNAFNNLEENRKEHNARFCKDHLREHREFFDTALGKYPLDAQQRTAIVTQEDNCLVISSAGSGKTSTIIGKTKYLVEKLHIDPSRILILTYTRKAANELQERLQMPTLACGTFHSLAYQIVTHANGAKPSICENSLLVKIFNRMQEVDADFLKAINDYIIDLQSLMQCEHDYDDAVIYHAERKKYGIQALFKDMDGNIIFTRSEEEKRLCSFLTRNGVDYRYEQKYEYETLTNEYRQYIPDFTIYYTVNGVQRHLYLEHLAIDSSGNVPRWFADNTRGGYRAANKRYREGIEWKRKLHKQKGTILIETTSAEFHAGTVYDHLREQLLNHSVPLRLRSEEELHQLLVERSRKVENNVFNLILAAITLMKSNEVTFEDLVEKIEADHTFLAHEKRKYFHIDKDGAPSFEPEGRHTCLQDRNMQIVERIFKPFYARYVQTLEYRGEIDYMDTIMQATTFCREGRWKQYDFILVDEFQDISIDRYKFLQALRSERPLTRLFCVGDDWQSIFRFSGSDMSLFYHFEDYFGYTELCKIETTYRFHEPLIGKSSMFVQKNPNQKRKNIVDAQKSGSLHTELEFVSCKTDDDAIRYLNRIIAQIPTDESILLIGRYNEDINSLKLTLHDDHNSIFVNICQRDIPFLSVHSAKGKEADHVFLLNCNEGINGFPSLITDDPILKYLLSSEENYPCAEERRLFYVAITRARKHMYVLYDEKSPSPFINDFQPVVQPGEYLCPKCLDGKVIVKRQSLASNGSKVTDYGCTNHAANCTYFVRCFGDHTHPGLLINSLEDVENLKRKHKVP